MQSLLRRDFLASSLGAIAAFSAASSAFGEIRVDHGPHFASSLFLTWFTDPTTTMVVQWIGPASAPNFISYSAMHEPTWRIASVATKPFPDSNLLVHRCELSGLTPGGEYRFALGTHPRSYRFRTMPAKLDDTITFVSGGDSGVDQPAINTNKLAAKQDPRFVFIGGDLAYDNGTSPYTFLKFLQNYSQHMIDREGRMIPLLSCVGNHETRGGKRSMHDAAPSYLSVFDGLFSETSYGVLDIGDYLSLVLLDTGHLMPVKGEQTRWLAKTLADRQDRPHLIVANHVPAYPSYRTYESTGGDNRKYWCPLFERFNVDVVLEHHDHTYKRTHPLKDGRPDRYGVPYLGDGSWGKLRSLQKPEERPYLAAYDSAYHVSVHRLEGDQRFHIALEDSGKVADVCMTASKRPAKRG